MYLYKHENVYVLTAVVHYVDDQAHVYGYEYVLLMCIPHKPAEADKSEGGRGLGGGEDGFVSTVS